jgi:hypothetical protein
LEEEEEQGERGIRGRNIALDIAAALWSNS